MANNIKTMDWRNLIISFLHDPPHKVVDIQHHEQNTALLLKEILQEDIEPKKIHDDTRIEDILAAGYERVFLPKSGMGTTDPNWKRAVNPENNKIRIVHPLSGSEMMIDISGITNNLINTILHKDLVITAPDLKDEEKFYILWRFLLEFLARQNIAFRYLPADSRIPDATIWNHLEISAGFKAVNSLQSKRYALLAFALSPVQSFIENARTAKDLWAGSYILSQLTFAGMIPILNQLGPCVFIYPSLRGNPFLDDYLIHKRKFSHYKTIYEKLYPEQSSFHPLMNKVASLPNKFFALVPSEGFENWVNIVEDAVKTKWLAICEKIREDVDSHFEQCDSDWSKRWNEQIENYFDIAAVVLPTDNLTTKVIPKFFGKTNSGEIFNDICLQQELAKKIEQIDRYQSVIPYDEQIESIGIWMLENKLASLMLDAKRSIRHVPENLTYNLNDDAPPKCTMFGTFEQMGPTKLQESSQFWEKIQNQFSEKKKYSIKKNERFCALGIVKRFYPELIIPKKFSFPDTATIAARLWLNRHQINPDDYWNNDPHYWSGQWLHYRDRNESSENQEEVPIPPSLKHKLSTIQNDHPPKYYAVLLMDGDHMGKWIQGENNPTLEKILHPKMIDYFQQQNSSTELLQSKKLVSPAIHAAISEALCNFSLFAVPEIVHNFNGELIYAGGDDVLALLPIENALECAKQLYLAFRGELNNNTNCPKGYYSFNNQPLLMMGPTATASSALVVAHYKEDFREVLQIARLTEKSAKNNGRNQLCISILRRSGTHSSAFTSWNSIQWLNQAVNHFRNNTDRWIYELRQTIDVFAELDKDTFQREIKRLIARSDTPKNEKMTIEQCAKNLLDDVELLYQRKHSQITSNLVNWEISSKKNFIELLHSTSFIAKGRD